MIWTILVMVIAIALYLFGANLINDGTKKSSPSIVTKCIKLVAIMLIAGCVCRLYTPIYLVHTNPLILQDMANNIQAKQNAMKNKTIRKFVRSHGKEMMGAAPVLGNAEAKKTIYVWTDFSCPYCRRVHGALERVMANRDDVRVVIKNFSIHGDLSDAPARAVIAAKMQDNAKAAKLASALMDKEFFKQEDLKDQSKIAEKVKANVMKFAKDAELDTKKLEEDMKSETVAKEMSDVRELAQEFEISGTPFLIIGEQSFPGAIPYDQIMKALDEAK